MSTNGPNGSLGGNGSHGRLQPTPRLGHISPSPPLTLTPPELTPEQAARDRQAQIAFSRLPPEIIRANSFPDEFRVAYEQLFVNLIRDSELMPGMGTLDDILSERVAFFETWLKERDARGPRARWAPHDYDRMNRLLIQCVQLRVNTAKALSIDEVTRRHQARAVASTLGQLIDMVALSPEQADQMKALAPAVLASNL